MLKTSHTISFVATSDANKAREFYENTLGLTFVSCDQFALVFDVSGTMLRIQNVDDVHPHAYTALGWAVQDIEKEVNELSRRGVTFARYDGMDQSKEGIWHAPSGAKIAWFADPDGNILSLTQFQNESAGNL